MSSSDDPERTHALDEYKAKLLESREWEAKLKALRLEIKALQNDFDVSEENIKALQSVGQIIGEVLKQLDAERCKLARELYNCRYQSSILLSPTCHGRNMLINHRYHTQSSSRPLPDRATSSAADQKSTR